MKKLKMKLVQLQLINWFKSEFDIIATDYRIVNSFLLKSNVIPVKTRIQTKLYKTILITNIGYQQDIKDCYTVIINVSSI